MDGAGQLRRLGRALFALNAGTVETVINSKISRLQEGSSEDINVRIFCTLGGGTGSGSLIDTITMLHSTGFQGRIRVFVYPFVAGAKAKPADSGSFFENEYAALRDLNALIVRKLKPHLVALNGEREARFECAGDPVQSVYISTELAPGSPDLDKQIQYMADACFDALVYSNNTNGVDCLRALSGEDLVQTVWGEPGESPERSYRFAALGGKRWCIPIALIRNLLVHEQLERIFAAHLDGRKNHGTFERDFRSFNVPRSPRNGVTMKTINRICNEVEAPLRRPVDDFLGNSQQGTEILIGIRETATAIIERAHGMIGEESIRRECAARYSEDVAKMMEMVYSESDRVIKWRGASTETWGIKDLDECLGKYEEELGGWANAISIVPTDTVLEEQTRRCYENMGRREEEWRKIGVLTHLLTSRSRSMVRDQLADALFLVDLHLRRFRRDLVQGLVDAYLVDLNSFRERINLLARDLANFRVEATEEWQKSNVELTDTGAGSDSSISDMYEFDAKNLAELRRQIGEEKDKFAEQMAGKFGPEWDRSIESLRSYSTSCLERYRNTIILSEVENAVIELDEKARQDRPVLKNVLVNSIIDYLLEQGGQDKADWEKRLGPKVRHFVGNMRCSTNLVASQGLTYPQKSPAKSFVIGFPGRYKATLLVSTLKEMIKNSIPTQYQGRISFYDLESTDEIRLLYIPYWLPARFSPVVDYVYDRYKLTVKSGAKEAARVYFANIDDEDIGLASSTRPSLTLSGNPDKDMRFKVELCKSLFVHTDVQDGKSPVLHENEKSQQLHVLQGIVMGAPDYGSPFASAEASYPGDKFKSAVAKALEMAQKSMSQEEKSAVLEQYRKRHSVLASERQPGDPVVQEALQDMKKVSDMLRL